MSESSVWPMVLVLFAMLTSGCGEQGPASGRRVAEIDTVNDVTIVRSGEVGLWSEEERWRIREDFRLGGVTGPEEEMFGSFRTAVSVGPHGKLFILDSQTDEVRVFDGDGNHRFTFAGAGRGPGELNSGSSMGWDGLDRLWIPNAFDGRYTVFDSLGALVKTTLSYGRRGVGGLLHGMYFDRRGSFIDHVADGGGLLLIRRDTALRAADTLARLVDPGTVDGPPLLSFMISDTTRNALGRFRPRLRWALAPDGTVWQARSDSLRLIQRSVQGDTLRIVETRHRAPAFTPAERRIVAHAESELSRLNRTAELVPQVVQAIHVLEDGHVMAQIPGDDGEPGMGMDVFDPQGQYLGWMNWPFAPHPRALHSVRGDTIYAVTLDSLEVPYVVRATLLR